MINVPWAFAVVCRGLVYSGSGLLKVGKSGFEQVSSFKGTSSLPARALPSASLPSKLHPQITHAR